MQKKKVNELFLHFYLLLLSLGEGGGCHCVCTIYAFCSLLFAFLQFKPFFNKFLTAKYWFSSAFSDWGFSQLLLRKDLEDVSKGFIVDDTLIVEAEIMVMSTASSSRYLSRNCTCEDQRSMIVAVVKMSMLRYFKFTMVILEALLYLYIMNDQFNTLYLQY